ncbi:type VI secretion protein [Paramixta manurensis]|uniref:Type VI secretion protein n=1 Tax=Paramixta manurensis TaxID=2740817 RepID=A0A6M8U863_9GAMM|nr:type VI secretion protein [Erwiniaceae bacterium PD-1]
MASKVKIITLISLTFFSVGSYAKTEYSAEQYIRNYALSTCISQGYNSKEVKDDSAAAARGYLEFGDYSLAAHTAVRKLGKDFLAKKYRSQSGESMTLAKCIDFYHSKELTDLINSFKGKEDD